MSVDFYKEEGPLGYLANYSKHGFYKNGVYYKTVEHYYQSEKFADEDIKNKIINAATPKEASNIGRDRKNIRIPNFKKIKNDVMYDGIYEKFSQNPDIRAKLIETGNEEIREMTVNEYYWGVGSDLSGANNVGKILMKVREKVKEDVLNKMIDNCRGKKIYVIGHSHPDFDSVASSLILTKILCSIGIDAVFAVRDTDFIDNNLINDYIKDDFEVVKDYNDKYFFLVDHNNLNGINKNQVVGCIDHHMITGEVDDIIEIEYASCALLIYDLFDKKYNFDNEDQIIIGCSVLSDTEYLTSCRFNRISKDVFYKLDFYEDIDKFKHNYLEVCDFNLPIATNLERYSKVYDIDGMKVKRSLIYSYSDDYEKYYHSYVYELKNNNIDLLIWCDYDSHTTYVDYNGNSFVYPIFTTSTNMVIKYLKENNYFGK